MVRALCILAAVIALAGCAAAPEAAQEAAPRPEIAETAQAAPSLVDTGVADAAAGTVDYDAGALVSYTAAEGDHFDAIAMRFGLTTAALSELNPDVPPDSLVAAGTVVALR